MKGMIPYMGMPSINIVFRTLGISAIKRSEKGIVALIVKDAAAPGGHEISAAGEIPAALGAENKAYIVRAFTGYVNQPRQVILYVMDGEDEPLDAALAYLAAKKFDYLAGTPDIDAADVQKLADWVKSQRQSDHMVKAVLPNLGADSEAVINFASGGLRQGETEFTTAQYCSRVAGLIAGTPMTISCTYAPLPELTAAQAMSRAQLDAAVDDGKLVLFHDGEKVKVGRGVTSLQTTIAGKGDAFKKIKIVEAMDMIKNDIRLTAEDSYIGKYPNSYDNKCLLIVAIKGYLEELERSGILARESSVVEIDTEAQRLYIKQQGIDVSGMSEQQIKEANTGSKVFLKAHISILDAIEDIELPITI